MPSKTRRPKPRRPKTTRTSVPRELWPLVLNQIIRPTIQQVLATNPSISNFTTLTQALRQTLPGISAASLRSWCRDLGITFESRPVVRFNQEPTPHEPATHEPTPINSPELPSHNSNNDDLPNPFLTLQQQPTDPNDPFRINLGNLT